jgi:hypothetical protein
MPKVKIDAEFLYSIIVRESNSPSNPTPLPPTKNPITIYETLYTENGFHNLKRWFLFNNKNQEGSLNEMQFSRIMRRLTNFRDYKILEIFDLLGKLIRIQT